MQLIRGRLSSTTVASSAGVVNRNAVWVAIPRAAVATAAAAAINTRRRIRSKSQGWFRSSFTTKTIKRSITSFLFCFLSTSASSFATTTASVVLSSHRSSVFPPRLSCSHSSSSSFSSPYHYLTMVPPDKGEQDQGTTGRPRRSSSRKKITETTIDAVTADETKATEKMKGSKKVISSIPRTTKDGGDDVDHDDKIHSTKKCKVKESTQKKTPVRRKRSGSESSNNNDGNRDSENPPSKKKKAPTHQVLTERDVIPKLWNASEHKDSYTFKIASWNVAGLRGLTKKDPDAIGNLIERLDLDVLCLQETKLQENHLNDPKVTLPQVPGFEAHYSCSTAKKGYAGTAAYIRKRGSVAAKGKQTTMDAFAKSAAVKRKNDPTNEILPVDIKLLQPEQISTEMGVEKHDQEGRLIVMDFPLFTVVNLYVPNSGQKLERLEYRTKEWDKDLLAFMQAKQNERGVPVLWMGDMNVAHTKLEVWNDGAKHLAKQAGVTVEERESFQAQLDAGFIDAFRKLHPDAKGHYSYWSQRAGNREPNKGLRLDYFVCDPKFFDADTSQVVVRDSYMVEDQQGSDHCPTVLEIEIKKE